MAFQIIDLSDVVRVAEKFKASADFAEHMKPVMENVATDMLRVTQAVFSSNGRRGGGSWARLKPDTVKKKGDTEILRTEHANPGYSSIGNNALYRSVTEREAEFGVLHTTNFTVEYGTDRPYAGVHQQGSLKRNIPARPFLRFTAFDISRWSKWVEDWTMQPWHTE